MVVWAITCSREYRGWGGMLLAEAVRLKQRRGGRNGLPLGWVFLVFNGLLKQGQSLVDVCVSAWCQYFSNLSSIALPLVLR